MAEWHLIQMQKVEMSGLKNQLMNQIKHDLTKVMIEQWSSADLDASYTNVIS